MKRRKINRTAEEKLRILEQADKCTRHGEIKALLLKEGLSSSTLSDWRKKRRVEQDENLVHLSEKGEKTKAKVINETRKDKGFLKPLLPLSEKELGINDYLWVDHLMGGSHCFKSGYNWIEFLIHMNYKTLEEARDCTIYTILRPERMSCENLKRIDELHAVTFDMAKLEEVDLPEHSVTFKKQDAPSKRPEVDSKEPNEQCPEQVAPIKTAIQTLDPRPTLQLKPVEGNLPPQRGKTKRVKSRLGILAILQCKIPFLQRRHRKASAATSSGNTVRTTSCHQHHLNKP